MRKALLHFFAMAAIGLALPGCATSPADISRWAALGGYDAVARIRPELYSDQPALRAAAIAALLKLSDDPDAAAALAIATVSPDSELRAEVGAALLFNPNEDLDFYGITLVADPDPVVRRQIAQALAALGRAGPLRNTERASVYLWGLTQDKNPDVRAAADEYVGSMGLNDPIDFALNALRHDPEPRVRAAAARGLGTLARAYLAGQRGPSANSSGANSPLLPGREKCEEIVTALCQAALTDKGKYTDLHFDQERLWSRRSEDTHWVAAAAADALTVPGITPRADVATALAVARSLGVPAPLPWHLHLIPSHHPGPL